jgi:hypothetical protein
MQGRVKGLKGSGAKCKEGLKGRVKGVRRVKGVKGVRSQMQGLKGSGKGLKGSGAK